MSLQTESNPTPPSAELVGNAFVEQYYHILHTSPEAAHRFYLDSSVLSRPDANGVMTSVATMQGINETILSLNFKDYKAEIKTADAQNSYKGGVTVLVTGFLTGKDNVKKKFSQSFFLAPQDNGYFVLNDVFRYVEDDQSLENIPISGVDDLTTVPLIPDPEPPHAHDPPAPDPTTVAVEEDKSVNKNLDERANDTLEPKKQSVNENEVSVEIQSRSNGNDVSMVAESASSAAQDDAPKKSYASIVRVVKGSLGPTKIYVPTNTLKATSKNIENQLVGSVVSATEPETSVPSSNNTLESNTAREEVEGHSIYIRNLPFNMTAAQLEVAFNKFGPIKEGGTQVRFNKQQGYCFGFVEFHSLSSMNKAIQASPMTFGGHQAVIEIKKTTTRVDSGRGRFPSGRAGYQNDSFRGRGNYAGSRGFGRYEFGNREFSGRGRNTIGQRGGYQQGRGRSGHLSGGKQNAYER